jgi:hypothetical protein
LTKAKKLAELHVSILIGDAAVPRVVFGTVMSEKAKRLVTWGGCILLGLTFVGAALVKFDYILPLEKDVMSFFKVQGDYPGVVIQFLPRLLIASELALGLTLCQPYWRRRLVLPACILMLLFFSGYLLSLNPAKENCGCFGAWLKMGPRASLLKNLVLLALSGVCLGLSPRDPQGKLVVPSATVLGSCLLVFILIPLRLEPPPALEERFAKLGEFQGAEGRSFGQGTALLCFFSATCEHCQAAAKALSTWPAGEAAVFMAMEGQEQEIEAFRALTGTFHFPWKAVDIETFYSNIGQAPPRIYLLKDGQVIYRWDLEIKLAELEAAIRGELKMKPEPGSPVTNNPSVKS